MKVRELIEQLSQFDDSLEIGPAGHFGELLEIYSVELAEIHYLKGEEYIKTNWVRLFCQSAGNSPE